MTPVSAIYEGTVVHSRRRDVHHRFAYPVWMLWLDLEEAEGGLAVAPLFSTRSPAPLRWRRADHLGAPDRPLAECARDLVAERGGSRPEGPVRLLTFARVLGLAYSPVSFYYLYDRAGSLVAAIAEVTSTPWNERRHYVLTRRQNGAALGGSVRKEMHVSPFMPMSQTYEWSPGRPGESLRITLSSREEGRTVFAASLSLQRRKLERRTLLRRLLAHPPQPQAALARIYLQAVRLKLRGARHHPRPSQPLLDRTDQAPARS